MDAPVRRLSVRERFVLRAALIAAWAIGVGGAAGSCVTLKYYQSPQPAHERAAVVASESASASSASVATSAASGASSSASPEPTSNAIASTAAKSSASAAPSASSPATMQLFDSPEAMVDFFSDINDRFRHTRIPLAIANLLLSLALLIGAMRTLARRVGGKAWLRQVCVATAVFAVAEYVVSRDERTYTAEQLVKKAISPDEQALMQSTVRWFYAEKALVVVMQLALFGGLAIALGRSSVVLELAPRDPTRRSVPPPPSGDA